MAQLGDGTMSDECSTYPTKTRSSHQLCYRSATISYSLAPTSDSTTSLMKKRLSQVNLLGLVLSPHVLEHQDKQSPSKKELETIGEQAVHSGHYPHSALVSRSETMHTVDDLLLLALAALHVCSTCSAQVPCPDRKELSMPGLVRKASTLLAAYPTAVSISAVFILTEGIFLGCFDGDPPIRRVSKFLRLELNPRCLTRSSSTRSLMSFDTLDFGST